MARLSVAILALCCQPVASLFSRGVRFCHRHFSGWGSCRHACLHLAQSWQMWAELGGFFRVRFWCSERSAVPPPNQAGFQEHIFEKISVSKRRKRRKKEDNISCGNSSYMGVFHLFPLDLLEKKREYLVANIGFDRAKNKPRKGS